MDSPHRRRQNHLRPLLHTHTSLDMKTSFNSLLCVALSLSTVSYAQGGFLSYCNNIGLAPIRSGPNRDGTVQASRLEARSPMRIYAESFLYFNRAEGVLRER